VSRRLDELILDLQLLALQIGDPLIVGMRTRVLGLELMLEVRVLRFQIIDVVRRGHSLVSGWLTGKSTDPEMLRLEEAPAKPEQLPNRTQVGMFRRLALDGSPK
jgi:hypothetical protein